MKNAIKEYIEEAYRNPSKKTFLYASSVSQAVAEQLGINHWDWTPQPTVNVEPWFWNTHTIPLTFGCPAAHTSEGKEWIKPLIKDPSQIESLEIPDVRSGRTGEILAKMEEMSANLPADTLIRLPDIQSPLGVAELMMDESFYFALLTNPKEIHILLEKISTFIIAYIKEIKKVLGTRYNPETHPQIWAGGEGFYLSDDVNSMISPEQHLEFSINYINKLCRELGPVYYHSCTWTPPYYENIRKMNHVKAANWSIGTSNDPAELMAEFSGRYMLIAHVEKGVHTEENAKKLGVKSEFDVIKYLVENMQDNTCLFINIESQISENLDFIRECYEYFDANGLTPAKRLL